MSRHFALPLDDLAVYAGMLAAVLVTILLCGRRQLNKAMFGMSDSCSLGSCTQGEVPYIEDNSANTTAAGWAGSEGRLPTARSRMDQQDLPGRPKLCAQHPLWLTFVDGQLERSYADWQAGQAQAVNQLFSCGMILLAIVLYSQDPTSILQPVLLMLTGVILLVLSALKHRHLFRETLFGSLLLFHTAVAPAIWLPRWQAVGSPLTWATRSLGCELLAIAPTSMLVRFRHLLLWQATAALLATSHVPQVCSDLNTMLPHTSKQPMQALSWALVVLQGFLAPLLFSYLLEKVARLLFTSRLQHCHTT